MAYPKVLEHSKNYLVQIQLFDDTTFQEPVKLNYLTTSFEIVHSGGSDFINQKGRNIASAFAKQPSVNVNLRCYMTDSDFSIVISNIILNQQQILITIGKLKDKLNLGFKQTDFFFFEVDVPNVLIDPSATIYEIIGFIKDAKISATAGEFIVVDISINADDVNEFDPNDRTEFKP